MGERKERRAAPAAVARPDQGDRAAIDLTGAKWRTSTRSGASGGDCVEVADNLPGVVLVRDSKDRGGATLTFPPTAWRAFVAAVPEPAR